MTIFDVISLAGGLALFLYGMTIMGNSLEKLAGGKTQSILQKLTSSTVKGVLLGAFITALIQSSSGTTVIVIGLVNSGIMQFSQAIGVIMGANIGTTVTGQLIRMADISGNSVLLQILKPTTLAPAAAFIGALLFMFGKSIKRKNIGSILLGFGILFTGMFAMEQAVAPLRESPWFIELFSGLQNPFLGILAGTLVTAVIQSSSASVGILQALTVTGVVTWGSAIPIILGQNIGTCATGLIASSGASRSAKRVAIVHLYFNIIGTALFVAGIYGFKAVVGIPQWNDPIGKGDIANFHTLFNIVATLVFIPFTKGLARLAEWTVPEKESEKRQEITPVVLDQRLYNSPSVAIAQARKAVEQMATTSRLNQQSAIKMLFAYDPEEVQYAEQREEVVDKLDVSVSNYLVNMAELELQEEESREVTLLLNFVTEFERIGDYAVNIIQRGGEIHDKEIVFSEKAKRELQVLSDAVEEVLDLTILALEHNDIQQATKVEPLEETIDKICEKLRSMHIKRLKNGQCNIDAGIVFLEVLADYERISDHCSNVAARMISLSMDAENFDPHALRREMHKGQIFHYEERVNKYREKYYALIEAEE